MASEALTRRFLASASTIAIVTGFLAAAPVAPVHADSYMAGDFHNHTTCTDGSTSIKHMITTSIQTFGLEWMATADHGGNGTRDCRYFVTDNVYWDQTLGQTIEGIKIDTLKGDVASSGGHRVMWRWQNIDDFVYQSVAQLSAQLNNQMIYVGLETNSPGHEHVSATILGAQTAWLGDPNQGNASSLAEWEYRFDRSDTDMSGKGGVPGTPGSGIWTGKVPNATGSTQGTLNHINKARPSVRWMQEKFPLDSYFVPAHVERAGVFDPAGNRGFNVEHFRDFNNDGPTVAVGFETMPGHQASTTRGEYRKNFGGPGIDSVGVTTYGGTGVYGAKIGGLWDAMLGEGRNWFFYASSDWHNRGQFGPFDRQSTQDFYPGEYQKLYIPRPTNGVMRPQTVIDAVRAGNSFSVAGDLITKDLTYTAEDTAKSFIKARMGETLVVPRGATVRITLKVNLPTGPNNSPYSFDNPSLLQLGTHQPINRPVLDHVDFIVGNVTGVIPEGDPNYTNPTNPTTHIAATFGSSNWVASGQTRTMTFTIPNVQNSQYVRVRGTNLPVLTPYETDAAGNPLADPDTSSLVSPDFIPCPTECPAHMDVKGGVKLSSYDVAAWSDLWFYGNPIFIRVADQPALLVETNKALAKSLAQAK